MSAARAQLRVDGRSGTPLASVGNYTGSKEDSAAAAVAAGEASFFECLCLVTLGEISGLAAGVGVCATNPATENAVNTIIRRIVLFMPGRLTKPTAAPQR